MSGELPSARRMIREGTEGKTKRESNAGPTSGQEPEKWGTQSSEGKVLFERRDRGSFVVFHAEDGVELRDLQPAITRSYFTTVQASSLTELIIRVVEIDPLLGALGSAGAIAMIGPGGGNMSNWTMQG